MFLLESKLNYQTPLSNGLNIIQVRVDVSKTERQESCGEQLRLTFKTVTEKYYTRDPDIQIRLLKRWVSRTERRKQRKRVSFQFRNRGGRCNDPFVTFHQFPSQGASRDHIHVDHDDLRLRTRPRDDHQREDEEAEEERLQRRFRRIRFNEVARGGSFHWDAGWFWPPLSTTLHFLLLLFASSTVGPFSLSPRIRRYHPLTFIFFFPEFSALFNGRTSLIEDART